MEATGGWDGDVFGFLEPDLAFFGLEALAGAAETAAVSVMLNKTKQNVRAHFFSVVSFFG
jgi:hypothetical protein